MNAHQRRVSMTRRHRQWPLGTQVIVDARGLAAQIETGKDATLVIADAGRQLLKGRVFRHIKGCDCKCDVEFAVPISIEGAEWLRFCHLISLRLLTRHNAGVERCAASDSDARLGVLNN